MSDYLILLIPKPEHNFYWQFIQILYSFIDYLHKRSYNDLVGICGNIFISILFIHIFNDKYIKGRLKQ